MASRDTSFPSNCLVLRTKSATTATPVTPAPYTITEPATTVTPEPTTITEPATTVTPEPTIITEPATTYSGWRTTTTSAVQFNICVINPQHQAGGTNQHLEYKSTCDLTNQHPTYKSAYGVQINIQSINQLPGYKSTPEVQFNFPGNKSASRLQIIFRGTNQHPGYISTCDVQINIQGTNQHPGYKSTPGVKINMPAIHKSTSGVQISTHYYYNIRGHGLLSLLSCYPGPIRFDCQTARHSTTSHPLLPNDSNENIQWR